MLRELSVQNLALIEDVHVELQGGYCAWTGETGAGKSLLLGALNLVLGGKASADLVRAGETEARAAAVFEVEGETLRDEVEDILGGPLGDEPLILTRRVSASGRSSSQANGLPVTAATLQALGAKLLDVHGQNEGRALACPDRQLALLDAHAGLGPLVAAYESRRESFETLRKRRLALSRRQEERARERALLEFERDELAAAAPQAGEVESLTREAQRLGSAEQVRAAASGGYALLYEADRSAQGLLERVARSLAPLSALPELAQASADLDRLAEEVREVAYALRAIGRDWAGDPARLDEVEARLSLYRRLAARFRCPADGLADRLAEVTGRLAALDGDDSELRDLDVPLAEAWQGLTAAASDLSAARRKAAKALAKAVQGRLKPLGLGHACLDVEVTTVPLAAAPPEGPAPEGGADRVEVVFGANPGEPPRPLRKVASGGELSRVTLAVKTVLAEVDRVPTLVFDEIDTGVGGRLGAALGKALAEVARHRQVICVTHLPQMASYADRQWVIRKEVGRGRSRTTIRPLDGADRVEELAAMLRGDSAADGTRHEALSMLQEARAAL